MPSNEGEMEPIAPAFVAVKLHALGVTGRPAAAVRGIAMVRTRLPDVVISSTYTAFVIEPVLNKLPVSSPRRTTARLPPVNGTGATVAAGVTDAVVVAAEVTVTAPEGVFDDVVVPDGDPLAVRAPVPVVVGVPVQVEVTDADEDGVSEVPNDTVDEGVALMLAVVDELAVTLAVIDELAEDVREGVCVPVEVADALADAGTNATLRYSTLADEGPRIELHTFVSVS